MSSYENALNARPDVIKRMSADRQLLLTRETETFFMNQCLEEYGKKRLERWNRDYSSIDA